MIAFPGVGLRALLIVGSSIPVAGDVQAPNIAAPEPAGIVCTPSSTATAPAHPSPRLELEAGNGQVRLGGQSLTAHYGLFGLTAGFQYPGLFSPRFVPARPRLDGSIA